MFCGPVVQPVPWSCFDLCFDSTRLDFDQQRSRELLFRDARPSANTRRQWNCQMQMMLKLLNSHKAGLWTALLSPVMPLIWDQNTASTLPQLFVFVWACACRCVSCVILFYGTLYDTIRWTLTLKIPPTTIAWLSCPLQIIVSNGLFLEWMIPPMHWVPVQALIPPNSLSNYYHCSGSNPCACKSAAIHSCAGWTKWRVASRFLITERVDDKTN